MDDRLLWVVPPSWGWAAAALMLAVVLCLGACVRSVRRQQRAGAVRTRSVVALWAVAALAVLMVSALCLFLLHDRVEFEDARLALG